MRGDTAPGQARRRGPRRPRRPRGCRTGWRPRVRRHRRFRYRGAENISEYGPRRMGGSATRQRDGATEPLWRPPPRCSRPRCSRRRRRVSYMTQPLEELYGGCAVVLKVSWCGTITCSRRRTRRPRGPASSRTRRPPPAIIQHHETFRTTIQSPYRSTKG